ncbi:MAG: ATP-binding protein [Acidobacteriota bacterium]|nr:ATP-binding protein [Acidobacteriota bacterium]
MSAKLAERLGRYRKDTRWIVAGLALLLFVLTSIYYFIQRSEELPSYLVTNRVLLFVLWNINLLLILAILFGFFRNLVKLLVERHNRILGSKLKTKLVTTYLLLSLIPVLLLFGYGTQLLHGWIERWFDEAAIKRVAEQGYAVAEGLNRQLAEWNQANALKARQEIESLDLLDPQARPGVAARIEALLSELGVDCLAVYTGTDFVHGVVLPQSGLRRLPEPGNRFLLAALRKGEEERFLNLPGDQGRVILTAAVSPSEDNKTRPVVVVGTLIDPELAAQSEELINAYQGFRQLEVRRPEIETAYRLTFLMVTLVLLLSTSWVGLYLARRVTIPIEAVAEGTRRLAEGDLDYRVEVPADDELGVLVDSFNQMTQQLKHNKEDLLGANQRLEDEGALIAAVLENVAAGVVSVDNEGRILVFNRAALRMLSQERPAAVEATIQDAWGSGELAKLATLFVEEPGPSGRLQRTVRLLLGGQWKTFDAKIRAMRDKDGNTSGRVMVLEDLTQLIHAQQRAAWHDAARRVAHEIKNPLTPIKLSAERILKRYQNGDSELGRALEEGVEIISNEVRTMESLVDEFSRFARMQPPRPTETDMTKLVRETLMLYDGIKTGVEIEGRIDSDAATAVLDRAQIKRVLINLLDNAVDATEPPGSVRVSLHKANGRLEIEVADTGPGIPASAREKLFLPHFSTKGRGTGLGLSIVHRIVDEHHGTVTVADNSPHGTVFSIQLPQN